MSEGGKHVGAKNTSPPTIKGTPQRGKTLVGSRGTWSEKPTDYNDFWMRCDRDGGSCSDISGANNKAGYLLKLVDVGNTIRSRCRPRTRTQHLRIIGADRGDRSPSRRRHQPPATGCPTGTGSVQVADVKPPARLLIDSQHSSPSVVHGGPQQIVLRYHVSACGGRSVQGALVYATPTPYNQVSIPGEQTTGADGFAELRFQTLAGFPVSRSSAARDLHPGTQSGDACSGISTRLFSSPVSLKG